MLVTPESLRGLIIVTLTVLVIVGGGLTILFWRKASRLGSALLRYWRSGFNGLCWLLTLCVAAKTVEFAWQCRGHVTCDFAGQWLIGRMVGQGRGYELYLVSPQREVLAQGYQGQELEWMYRDLLLKGMWNSRDNSTLPKSEIEGPLYPPIWGLFTQLWAWLPPEPAHRIVVLIYALLAFAAAWCVRVATDGKLRMGEAALAIWLFPNCYHGLVLGQNSLLTVFLLAAGWALLRRQRPWAAGLVWGMLAYKPVFFAALFWLPWVLMNWRMGLGMALSGSALVLITIPFLLPPISQNDSKQDNISYPRNILRRLVYWDAQAGGWRIALTRERLGQAWAVWQRWWQVGRRAADIYDRDENWVWMSRDLYALPRRPVWDWASLHAHWLYGWGHDYWPDFRDPQGQPLPTWRWERPDDPNNPGGVLIVRKDGSILRLQQTNTERLGNYFGLQLPATIVSRFLLMSVVVLTGGILVGLPWWRRCKQLAPLDWFDSPAGAFLMTGGLLSCFHFMHYDLHPLVLPMLILMLACFRPHWWEWESERTWPRIPWLIGRAAGVFSVALIAALWLACYYNLAFQRGPVRFPFETIVALTQWFTAGLWAILEYWPTGSVQGNVDVDASAIGQSLSSYSGGRLIGGWEPS